MTSPNHLPGQNNHEQQRLIDQNAPLFENGVNIDQLFRQAQIRSLYEVEAQRQRRLARIR